MSSAPETATTTTTTTKDGRLTHWFAVMAFSIIALAAITTNFDSSYSTPIDFSPNKGDYNITDQTKTVKWVVSAISIALSLASISVLAHVFIPQKFKNTHLETGMAVFTVGFWIAAMPAIMDPDQNLAVDSYVSGVSNLNLYFFSWAAFIVSFLNFMACLKNTVDMVWTAEETKLVVGEHRCSPMLWSGCILMSFVVMIASSRIHIDLYCADAQNNLGIADDIYDAVCDRTKFGVSLGAISSIIAPIWLVTSMFWKGSFGTVVEFFLVTVLMMMWTAGVVVLTFDKEKSPGRELGNLYFFTWGGWALFVFLFMASYQNFMSRNEGNDEANAAAENDEMKDKPDMAPVDEEAEMATENPMDA